MDPEKQLIKHRLYRQHATINKNNYVKDISKLGRDLSRTIIIDNVWENFQLQPNPASDKLTLIANDKSSSSAKIIVTDIIGNIVMEKIKPANQTTEVLDIRKLTKGFYTVTLESAAHKVVRKFVKE